MRKRSSSPNTRPLSGRLRRSWTGAKPRDEGEQRTSGIEKRAWTPQEGGIKLNIWDFAGQEITRGTHQYFLTERSLYLLVLEDRRQDDQSIYEWLKIVLNRGKDAPIIVVINKSDKGKQELALPEEKLKRDYPQIVAFLRASCDPDAWARASIDKLRKTIVKTLAEAPQLKATLAYFSPCFLDSRRHGCHGVTRADLAL
jgi:internalin A